MANVLIRGGVVYSPEPLGIRDILIIGGSVVAIEESINKKQLGLFCKTLKTTLMKTYLFYYLGR